MVMVRKRPTPGASLLSRLLEKTALGIKAPRVFTLQLLNDRFRKMLHWTKFFF